LASWLSDRIAEFGGAGNSDPVGAVILIWIAIKRHHARDTRVDRSIHIAKSGPLLPGMRAGAVYHDDQTVSEARDRLRAENDYKVN